MAPKPKATSKSAPKKAAFGKRTERPSVKAVARIAEQVTIGTPAVTDAAASGAKKRKAVPPVPPRPSAPEPRQAPAPVEAPKAVREPTYQINFKASETMTRIINRLSEQAGGTRVLFAKLLQDAGHDIPDQDTKRHEMGRRRNI